MLLEIGTRFELRIHVNDPPQNLAIPVEVVSHDVGTLDVDPEVSKQLDEFCERLVR